MVARMARPRLLDGRILAVAEDGAVREVAKRVAGFRLEATTDGGF